ncbi:MAG TPA: N-acetyltransferase [Terriglobales bacterium]|nr:N-acetyltransferase [Terriglobales bacterium]
MAGADRYELRDSRPADFRRLWQIDQICFAPGIAYSQRELAYYMKMRGAFTIVAVKSASAAEVRGGKGVVGFVVGQILARGLGHVVTIDVMPEVRRAGLGTLLMNECEARLRAAGCRAVYLESAVDNEPALRFYKLHGYSVLKTIPRYYMNTIDALMLGKNL